MGRVHSYLRISLTERCNLRCKYCMPAEGVQLTPTDKLLTADEIVKLANLFCSQGVHKIRLTGGEPLVRKDLLPICSRIAAIPQLTTLAITTNGIVLPRLVHQIRSAGVNAINISLDTLDELKFQLITRRKGVESVLKGIDMALQAGFTHVKVNCVVMRDINADEIVGMVKWAADKPICIRFIEYMPFDGNKWNNKRMMTYLEMLDILKSHFPTIQRCLPSPDEDIAKVWKVPNHASTIGFITSMSNHFCHTCNRLRITADGNLKVCLFGKEEVSLRDALRGAASDEQLLNIIQMAVKNKRESHGGVEMIEKNLHRPMITIGG
eukprot:c5821_g1_i2.p1 GENE.c5821_g1_i2~~c5821_g1_i2.p1  ORF type:complete len:323 (-),score=67.71 c5821_g1_i2:853-1821(-)